jgi:hypothetical protein
MDTDDLTQEAYRAILVAREASPILGAQLAVAGTRARTEDEFLRNMLWIVEQSARDPEDTSDALGSELSPKQCAALCIELREHILATLAKPIGERGPTAF